MPVQADAAPGKVAVTTGTIPFSYHTLPPKPDGKPYETYYEVWGDLKNGQVPLVALHGGPGADCQYMALGYGDLAKKTGRPLVIYDQIGNGRSSHVPDSMGNNTIWQPEMFVAELDNLIWTLGIDKYHLAGQSWGAMLAGFFAGRAYEGTYPSREGLQSLVLQSGPARESDWAVALDGLVDAMPADVSGPIRRAAETGDYEDPAYRAALMKFYEAHLCRVVPFPDELAASFGTLEGDPTVYGTMWGPDEVRCVGNLKNFDITSHLANIDVPVLLINGEFDEAQDNVCDTWRKGIKTRLFWVTMRGASHMNHVEKPDEFSEILRKFLA